MKSCAWAARAAVIASSGAGVGPAVDEVVADRAAEQERLLEHDADVPPEVAVASSRTSTPSSRTRPESTS